MIKNILGSWGANLDDDDYSCALAALGVLESTGIPRHRQRSDSGELAAALEDAFALGERTPVWGQAKDAGAGTTIASWHETVYDDPAVLAAAWRQFSRAIHHERALPRLAVPLDWRDHPDFFNVDDLYSWLQRADGLNALVMAKSRSDIDAVAWHWPLRVGVPEGPEHADILDALRAAQRQRPWVDHLARCFTVGSARDACDLMVLSAAAGAADKLPGRIRASFVACLEDPPPERSSPGGRYRDLQERLGAAGVAAVGRFDAAQLGDWFVEVLRQVSHDVPIHAALWNVGRHRFNRDPLIIGDPQTMDTCRILAIAERQDRIVEMLTTARADAGPITRSAEPTFGGMESRSDAPSSGDVQPRFADEIRSRMFTSESVDGESVARDFERRADEIHEARAPRWIHADAWRGDAPAGTAGSLAPAQWNLIAVQIGPSGMPRSDAAFPDAKLDFTRGNVGVNVQMELAGSAVRKLGASTGGAAELLRTATQFGLPATGGDDGDTSGIDSAEILLPPAGASTRAWFAVYPEKRAGRIEGRISIIHNNRVLQTARLWIEIDGNAKRGEGVVVRSEANIHAANEDLVERRAYDVAIQVSDVGGKLHLTIDRDGEPLNVRLDDLSSAISRISKGIERIAKERDFAKAMLAQPVFTKTLQTLAAAGAELEQHLRKKCGNAIDGWERIHLVPSTNEFFPLEYVYDGPPPKQDAAACPNLLTALERGSCDRALGAADAAAPCPHRRDKSFTCPMHFWGFRKLIERNGTVEAPATSGEAPASSHQALCVPAKRSYCKVNGLLFAASNRAFLYAADAQSQAAERQDLVKALNILCGTVSDASDWDEWRQGVTNKPNLLVLIAHTAEDNYTPVLEIGDGKLLGRQEILNDVSGAAGQPQLLILLGCSAADVMENFQPYPERFRDAGVSIVLAPVASIRGADAVPIAKRLAELLAENIAKPDPTAFGDLLPVLRRRLLRDGHAGVMAVVGFGDGDWLLGGQPC